MKYDLILLSMLCIVYCLILYLIDWCFSPQRYDKAVQAFEKVLELDSDCEAAKHQLRSIILLLFSEEESDEKKLECRVSRQLLFYLILS